MDTLKAITQRISANHFDPTRALSAAEITELVEYATNAPSSFNIQHWRFVAVVRPEDKARLQTVAFKQQKIADAAVTFIVLGDLRGHEKMPEIVQRAVAAGQVDEQAAAGWAKGAARYYIDNEQLARDEAIRSASLAAMTLMLVAEAKGLVSGPMIGFDPAGVKREFDIADRYVPAMLIAVGYAAPGNTPRKPRLTADEVLAFDRAREF